MDELEFRKRVYANPDDPGEEALEAARSNPDFQHILEQTRKINSEVSDLVTTVAVPDGLAERLRALPETGSTTGQTRASTRVFQYYAVAASMLMVVGLVFAFNWSGNPASSELAFGSQVIEHLYHEEAEFNAIYDGSLDTSYGMPAINTVMANAGSSLASAEFLRELPVRYANPCLILPGNHSAHLIVQTSQGPLSVIVIDNSPVSQEFTLSDERFNALVIPMQQGNLILVGDTPESAAQYRQLFTDNLEWVI